MISRTAEHALRAVLYLACRRGEGPVPVETIAAALGAPRNYLSKTLYVLGRQGIVDSVRGVHGGFWLAADPAALSVAQLAEPFADSRASGQCLLGGRPCAAAVPCAAHRAWTAVTEAARRPLATTTIADLLGRRDAAAACGAPDAGAPAPVVA
jgi:Rrf2 family protein